MPSTDFQVRVECCVKVVHHCIAVIVELFTACTTRSIVHDLVDLVPDGRRVDFDAVVYFRELAQQRGPRKAVAGAARYLPGLVLRRGDDAG